MFDRTRDATVRNAAFTWLKAQVDSHGDVLPRALLAEGFTFSGVRVPLAWIIHGDPAAVTGRR